MILFVCLNNLYASVRDVWVILKSFLRFRSCVRSMISFVRPSVSLSVRSRVRSFRSRVRWFAGSLVHWFVHSFVRSLGHPGTRPQREKSVVSESASRAETTRDECRGRTPPAKADTPKQTKTKSERPDDGRGARGSFSFFVLTARQRITARALANFRQPLAHLISVSSGRRCRLRRHPS